MDLKSKAMGRSKPRRKMRCVKCYAKDWMAYERDRSWGRTPAITWHAIDVVGRTASGRCLCKCRRCGHEYTSTSRAALVAAT